MDPLLRIVCPDPSNEGLWVVETPEGERLRGVTRVVITLDAEHGGSATAVVTFIGVHVDVKALAKRNIELLGTTPFEPGEAPAYVSEATLPTDQRTRE